MNSVVQSSAYFGFFITLFGYWMRRHRLQKKTKSTLCNPLLINHYFYHCIFKTDGNISYASYDNWRKIH